MMFSNNNEGAMRNYIFLSFLVLFVSACSDSTPFDFDLSLTQEEIDMQYAGSTQEQDLERAYEVDVVGNYAYVADGGGGLKIIDIKDPKHPVLKSKYATNGWAEGIKVIEDYAYVADGGAGFKIFYVNDPSNPILKGSLFTSGWVYRVVIDGHYAFLADGKEGIKVVDITNPEKPTIRAEYKTRGTAYNLRAIDDKIYIATGKNGIEIVNIKRIPK